MDYGDPDARRQLAEALDALPRQELALLPTPVERLTRLGEAWGMAQLWIKRDDLSGLAFGGTTARKLEFLLGHAQQKRARTFVTGGHVDSPHARDAVLAAKRCGMQAEVVLAGERADAISGHVNVLDLLGVPVAWVKHERDVRMACIRMTARLKIRGERPYLVPAGGANGIGAVGTMNAIRELVDQCEAMDEPVPDVIVAPAMSGAAIAGLHAGCQAMGLPTEVIGVCVADPSETRPATIAKLAADACKVLKLKSVAAQLDAVQSTNDYVGEGYGIPTERGDAAVATVARHEGILLDPIHTGKAMGGIHGMLESGRIDPAKRILFWQTDGALPLVR